MAHASGRVLLPGDIIIYMLVAAAAVFSIFSMGFGPENPIYAEVSCSGVKTQYPLDTDASFIIENEGYSLTLIIKDGGAFIEASSCPDQICVSTGKITKTGRWIVCLPAKVSVRLIGKSSLSDAIAG